MLDLVGAGAAPELRAIYRCRDRDQAVARLYDWTVTWVDSHVPELRRLARSGRDHRGPLRTQCSDRIEPSWDCYSYRNYAVVIPSMAVVSRLCRR